MAITKLIHMKESSSKEKGKHLKNAVCYILNPEKTAGGLYMNSNCGCDANEIYQGMIQTKKQHGKTWGRQGYHFVISFAPGEATEETAFAVMQDFTDQYLKDEYDYVYVVHNDKEHIHGHLIFNSLSYSGYKYHYKEGQWKNEIQPVTDSICRKYGLNGLLEKEIKTGRSYKEWKSGKNGNMTWRQLIRKELDIAVKRCADYEEMLLYLKKNGYLIREGISKKHGPYLAIRPPDIQKAIRTYTLGKDYQVQQLKKRLRTEDYVPYFKTAPGIRLYRISFHIQTATYYQLYHVAHYHKVKHFYNHQGWKYRKERMEIGELFLQCSYLLTQGIKSEKELAEKIDSLNIQERELYHMRSNLTSGYEDINESLKSLRRERKMLKKIQERTKESKPEPAREKKQEEIENDRGTVKKYN